MMPITDACRLTLPAGAFWESCPRPLTACHASSLLHGLIVPMDGAGGIGAVLLMFFPDWPSANGALLPPSHKSICSPYQSGDDTR
jgi:hypothetical protein